MDRDPDKTTPGSRGKLVALGGAAFFLLAALALVLLYAALNPIAPLPVQPPPERGYDSEAMLSAVAPGAVAAAQEEILAIGSRFMGQPGALEAAEKIRARFEAAGLEIYTQSLQATGIASSVRDIARAAPGGASLEVFPFFPNFLQPGVTGPEGLTARLELLTPERVASQENLEGVIGLIDCREGKYDEDIGFDWAAYARLGIRALVLAHPDGLAAMPWEQIGRRVPRKSGLVSSVPVNYVRVAAGPEVFGLVGGEVRLRVTSTFQAVPAPTIFGVLRAENPVTEALVLPFNYDAPSLLPDLAPGGVQSFTPALAMQLVEGLSKYRKSLRRDVIFMATGAGAMAQEGHAALLRVLGLHSQIVPGGEAAKLLRDPGTTPEQLAEAIVNKQRIDWILERRAANTVEARRVRESLAAMERPEVGKKPAATGEALAALDDESRDFLEDQLTYVLNTLVVERNEPLLDTRLVLERNPEVKPGDPRFQEFQEKKRAYDKALSAAGMSFANLLENKAAYVKAAQVRERLSARLRELSAFHAHEELRSVEDLRIAALFDGYARFAQMSFFPAPVAENSSEKLLFVSNSNPPRPEGIDVWNVLRRAIRDSGGKDRVTLDTLDDLSIGRREQATLPMRPIEPGYYSKVGEASYAVVHLERRASYATWNDPALQPFMRNADSLRGLSAAAGEFVLAVAHGNGSLAPVPDLASKIQSFAGKVLLSGVGRSVVPNYPLAGALVASPSYKTEEQHSEPGYFGFPYAMTDPYGRYDLPRTTSSFINEFAVNKTKEYSPIAAGHDRDGRIVFMKDEGEDGQRLFKSVGVNPRNLVALRNTTIVTFRAAPVSVLDLTNPQTLRDYDGVKYVDREGLAPFRKIAEFEGPGTRTAFISPDEQFYIQLESGAAGNELVRTTRAFALNTADDPPAEGPVIQGEGYLAADTPFLLNLPFEVAKSMVNVNQRRLDLQNRYGMADELTNEIHDKARQRLDAALDPATPPREASTLARDAVTLASLDHPVLRQSIFEAVLGVMWYLALLVPFVFFFEKLVFCYPDVRKQLAAQAGIFLTVFVLLRILHPAFQMVRSSLMILLGFIIVLICLGVTLLMSGRFKENLEALRKKQGKVGRAEVDTISVLGTAFLLGLNNMHRRKVRTGLTCATLVLLTFVMISFTTVRNEIVDENTALGRAPYQGMLIKREQFAPVTGSEIRSLERNYGDRYDVVTRSALRGIAEAYAGRQNPKLTAVAPAAEGRARTAAFDSIIQWDRTEPLRQGLRYLTESKWFPEASPDGGNVPIPVLIPGELAESLGLAPAEVDQGGVTIEINGRVFRVAAIFDSQSLADLRDLDGVNVLPYDVTAMGEIRLLENAILAEPDDPRLPASRIVLAPPGDLRINVPDAEGLAMSAAISMPDAPYIEAKETLDEHMQKTAAPLFYGLDGIAYEGSRARRLTLAGLIDLAIPLLIAGLTVLNTMRGSVYERRSEIYVYNAVGIAPKFIFFMFIAEAFVYAVVGSVLGYILSQGVGRILTELSLTGGMNMTFTSLATIYASLTIVAAVFISTYFPARSAMAIAAPADDAGWELPEPDGDTLELQLPFTFDPRDRLAVLEFFRRFLDDLGEGSAGAFLASPPLVEVHGEDFNDPDRLPVPVITSTLWPKPFDLGVSERMDIALPYDEDTRLYQARLTLTRLSGTRESWLRLTRPIVAMVRRQFLHWRALTDEERGELYEEARGLLERLAEARV